MAVYRYASRLRRMDQLIRFGRTGTAHEFAQQLNLSPSQLKEYLRDMRDLGAPITYCRHRRSYCYDVQGHFQVKFSRSLSAALPG